MSYWEDRQEETLNAILDKADVSSKEISNLYAKSSYYINEKVQGIFDRYRAKYDIGIQEATELLNQLDDPTSYDEMLSALKKSKSKERQELLKKLEAPAFRHRINRLQELQKVIDDVMVNVYNQEKNISTAHYIDSAQESYYRTTYNIQHDIGYEYNFAGLDSKKVDKLLKNRWSGANYSQRIWSNTQTLASELKENLLLGMMTGMSEREMIQSLTERFQVSNFKARRLIETESAYISTMMDMEAYKEADIDTMKFMAIHDMKTSKICQKHDGKYVKISEAKAGVNVPPLHPHCRSRMRPVIDEEFDRNLKRRVRKEDGTYEIVDANETYEQWYNRVTKKGSFDSKTIVEAKQKKEMWIERDKLFNIDDDEWLPFNFKKKKQIEQITHSPEVVNEYFNYIKFYTFDNDVKKMIRNDMAHMPLKDLEFIKINKVRIFAIGEKRYYKRSKIGWDYIKLNKYDVTEGNFAHEFAHMVFDVNKLYKDDDYLSVLNNVFNSIKKYRFKEYDGTEYVIVESDFFVRKYQGRTYVTKENFLQRGCVLDAKELVEYISVGYETFITNPELLYSKDRELYNYFSKIGMVK